MAAYIISASPKTVVFKIHSLTLPLNTFLSFKFGGMPAESVFFQVVQNFGKRLRLFIP